MALTDPLALARAEEEHRLGLGELSVILLAPQIRADLILIDDGKARRLASRQGLVVAGTIGLLEQAYLAGLVSDLAEAYQLVVNAGAYIDPLILRESLTKLKLPPQ